MAKDETPKKPTLDEALATHDASATERMMAATAAFEAANAEAGAAKKTYADAVGKANQALRDKMALSFALDAERNALIASYQ